MTEMRYPKVAGRPLARWLVLASALLSCAVAVGIPASVTPQSRLQAHRTVFIARVVESYKAGPAAYVDGLLSSQNFSELVDRYSYYESALNADSILIDQIQVLQGKVEGHRAAVEKKERVIADA